MTPLEFALMASTLTLGAMCFHLWRENRWLHDQLIKQVKWTGRLMDDLVEDDHKSE